MICQDATMSLGVYLLGALDEAERAEVDAHLRDCPDCRAQLAELEALPTLMDRLTLDDFEPEPPRLPDDLFARVQALAEADDAARERSSQRRRYRRLVAVAAAAVVIAGAGVGSWAAFATHGKPYHGGHPGQVQMDVSLSHQATGTALKVDVSGLPRNEHCTLIAVAKDGTRDVAGRWDATYAGHAQEVGSTSIPETQLADLVLLGTDGNTLVTVDV